MLGISTTDLNLARQCVSTIKLIGTTFRLVCSTNKRNLEYQSVTPIGDGMTDKKY